MSHLTSESPFLLNVDLLSWSVNSFPVLPGPVTWPRVSENKFTFVNGLFVLGFKLCPFIGLLGVELP